MLGIGEAVSSVFNLGKTWLDGRNQKQKNQQELEKARTENEARLLRDAESNNSTWEMSALTHKDDGLRRISFAILVIPFIVAILFPNEVKYYFEVIRDSVPIWWVQIFVSVNGAIWGIHALKNVIPPTIAATINAIQTVFKKK